MKDDDDKNGGLRRESSFANEVIVFPKRSTETKPPPLARALRNRPRRRSRSRGRSFSGDR